ncbi:MAG: hypothetical protein KDI74_07725 [Gammaproteobacteria bacterium]|nr:hypothetical protein [Gammaproteobacteria bacterium]
MKIHSKCRATRLLIAHEAARILANQESWDFQGARRKAAARLGCKDQRCLPDNREIDAALHEYQLLFRSDSQPEVLRQLRRMAVEAMQQFQVFSPRLTGPVLEGTADRGSPVQLFLFADTAEELILHLMEKRIPFDQREIRMRHSGGNTKSHPIFAFQAGDAKFELILLSPVDRANPPLDSQSDKPGLGAGLSRARALLNT